MCSKVLNILLIEDNPVYYHMIHKMLGNSKLNFQLTWEKTLAGGLKQLSEKWFNTILLDLDLPDSSGLNTLKSITNEETDCAIVVIASSQNEQIGLEALKAGAHDYLSIDNNTPNLLACLLLYAHKLRDYTKTLKSRHAQLEKEVVLRTKELTEANRKLQAEIEAKKQTEKTLAESTENIGSTLFFTIPVPKPEYNAAKW